jgi:hypothetical protein
MVRRRRLHKLFDSLKCDFKDTVMERSGHAGDKNLVFKECLVSLDQLRLLKNGQLYSTVESISSTLEGHAH